jgi:hypothetical protein
MGEKNKNGAGRGKWTECLSIHFGWFAAASLPSRRNGEGISSAALARVFE